MAKVAFLGLGVMGYPMAGHLKAKGGHDVTVYNRTAAKAEAWLSRSPGTTCAASGTTVSRTTSGMFLSRLTGGGTVPCGARRYRVKSRAHPHRRGALARRRGVRRNLGHRGGTHPVFLARLSGGVRGDPGRAVGER